MKKSKKYSDILVAAEKLFSKYGIRRVTIDEICEESNVSKMTFYKYFTNKNELVKTTIDNFFSKHSEHFEEIIQKDFPVADKIKAIISLNIKASKDTNTELLLDIHQNKDMELAQYFDTLVKQSIERTIAFILDAQTKGEIRQDIKPELFLVVLQKMNEILSDKNILNLYGDASSLLTEVTDFFIYGLFDKRK